MKLCANVSMLFTEYPLAERIAAARQAGFSAIEVQFPYELSCEQWRERLDASAMKLALINLPAGDLMSGGEGLAAVPDRRKEFKAALAEGLRYAKVLQVDAVNILPGVCHDPEHYEQYRATLVSNLTLAACELQKIGVRATFEAINTHDMPHFMVSSLASMQNILADVNHPNLFMQYDCYHMARMQEPLLQQLPNIIERVGHIQFADCPGRGQPGSGQLDYRKIFQTLESLNYPFWLGAEYHPQDGNSAKSLGWLSDFPHGSISP